MAHRPLHHQELEPRFRRPVEVVVAHRLPPLEQAGLEGSLEWARQAHHRIHEASRILTEGVEHQLDLRRAARAELRSTIAAAEAALEALDD